MTPGDHLFRTILDSTVNVLARHVRLLEAQLTEQDKLIANLTEENERLKPPAKKMTAILKSKAGKNPSWRNSAWLGVREGLWMAPSVWLKHLKQPVIMIGAGLILLIGKLLLCPIGVLVTFGLGICGRLVEEKKLERQ
jgi:hypothetical protein